MFFQRKRRSRGIAGNIKVILVILLTAIIIYIVVSGLLLQKISRQAIREMSDLAELYTDELDHRFFRISRRLFSTVMEKKQAESVFWTYVERIKKSEEDSVGADYAVGKLREFCMPYAWEYGSEYQFFLYLEASKRFIMLTMDGTGYEPKTDVREGILMQIEEVKQTSYSVRKKWNSMSWRQENYICKIAQNQDVYLGCYVNVESILEPFSKIVVGKEGYVRLVDEQDRIVGELTSRGIETSARDASAEPYSIIKDLKQAPFHIQMNVSSEKIWGILMGSLVFLAALAGVLILAGAVILLYLRAFLFLPVQRFVNNLVKYDEGDYTFHLNESNLLELEQIDEQFRQMIHQIRRLKITLYEQELEKQKIEMDYLKLQIRPHFYLNCLNFIDSMIDFGQFATARRMTRATSGYLQYVFQSSSEMVTVKAEADHCQDYLDILLLRYPENFEYYFEIHEEIEDAEIFPFLLQIFVENAAKHALTLEEKILISVTAFPEDRKDGTWVNLYISDTGRGFPPETLALFKQGKGISEGAKHLGIENCIKRFRYFYGDRGEMNFDNSPLGGVIVDIHIPYSKYRER